MGRGGEKGGIGGTLECFGCCLEILLRLSHLGISCTEQNCCEYGTVLSRAGAHTQRVRERTGGLLTTKDRALRSYPEELHLCKKHVAS